MSAPSPAKLPPTVLQEMARVWQVEFDATQARIIPDQQLLSLESLAYAGKDLGTDLVLMYTLTRFVLSEKPELQVLWKSVLTASTYDRPIVTYISGEVTADKRDATEALQRIWQASCRDLDVLHLPVSEQLRVLEQESTKAGPMFDAAIPVAVETCRKALRPLG